MRVYAITPDRFDQPVEYAVAVGIAVRAGVTTVQFRDKRARDRELTRACAEACARLCRDAGVMFVVNDDAELALEVGADAVHVGPSDRSPGQIRALVGNDFVIGGSAGTTERALELVASGVDYLGVGAIFDAAPSKPNASAPRGIEILERMRSTPGLESIPLVAIGGIEASTARACILAGADGVATIRGILGARDILRAIDDFRLAVDAS